MLIKFLFVTDDGRVDSKEFTDNLKAPGLTQESAMFLFTKMDANNDQNVDKKEADALFVVFDANCK